MNSSPLTSVVGRRTWISGLLLAVAAALVSALVLTSSSQPASASLQQTASTLDTQLSQDHPSTEAKAEAKADRRAFHTDLKAARHLKGQARADAVKKVRADARAGTYGDTIEKRLGRRADHRAAVFALLPDELQADLTKLRAMKPGDERKAFRDDIRDKALSGGYGEKVEAAAEKLEGHWKD